MFPWVSGQDLATGLCLYSSRQHRVGRASTCSVLSPQRTGSSYVFSSKYFGIFPQVSCPEFVTKLCSQSKQHRVGRASICFHRTQQYCHHSAPTRTHMAANTSCFREYQAPNLQQDQVCTAVNNTVTCRVSTWFHLTQQYCLHGAPTQICLSIIAAITLHVFMGLRPITCNRTVSPPPTTPCRSCVSTASSHSAVPSPRHAPTQNIFIAVNTSAYFHKYHAQSL